MYLLDTNVVSELRTGKLRQAATVREWASAVPLKQQFLSSVTLLELERGVLSLERRDRAQSRILRVWLDSLVLDFQSRLLDFGPATASLCAKLRVPNRMPEIDAMLAATALEHGLTLVTRNVADFERTGVPVLNPWSILSPSTLKAVC